jgi:hypothetical protein
MKKPLLSLRDRLVGGLRDPILPGLVAAISLYLFVEALFDPLLRAVRAWLLSNVTVTGWSLVAWAVALLGLPIVARRIEHRLSMARRAAHGTVSVRDEKHLEEAWGVLWPWPPTEYTWYSHALPVCPTHYLKMRVDEPATPNGFYMFVCRGDQGEPEHTIVGPDDQQLGGLGLRSDVDDRIGARRRREQIGA